MPRLGRLLCLFLLPAVVFAAEPAGPPPTPKKPATDEYHGVKVIDDYRWLENADDPAVKPWLEAQDRYTRSVLDQFPKMGALRQRVKELLSATSPDHGALQMRNGTLFAIKRQPPKQQPFLITLKSADEPDSARVLVDPNEIDRTGHTAIDFYVPSLDGKLVAVSLSEGGTEEGTVYVFETATGKKLADAVPRVQVMGGGSVAWNADGSGFWYTRYPRGNERPKEDRNFYCQVYFHELDKPTEQDKYSMGKDLPKIAEVMLHTSDDGKHVLAVVQKGDGGEFIHFLLGPSGKWVQFTQYEDKVTAAAFGPAGNLYLVSHQNAPRGKLLKLPVDTPVLAQAKTVVEQGPNAINDFTFGAGGYWPTFLATPSRLYVVDLAGGPTQIRMYDHEGQQLGTVSLPPVASVSGLLRTKGDAVLFRSQTYLDPPAWYRFDPAAGTVTKTALFRTSPADFRDCEVVREFATSKDGTKVPLNLLRKKGTKLDGKNPTLLYGYGGYNISLTPGFSVANRIWLDQGGVYAVANLRGGGEYGEEWHTAGNLTKKQNVFDDFAACARHLIDRGYTSPAKLAIEGGSNGGLLMGAALTQHPELFRAVVSHVGIYDMLRVELHPNGAFNVTEFGTVKDPEQFQALYAYSPYHHVKDGAAYPAVLFLTGANDPRVDPANSRKMTARLQAATSPGRPVLLRYSFGSGHGAGTGLSEQMAQVADGYAFLFQQLGIEYKQ